jgi:hypothetical protein
VTDMHGKLYVVYASGAATILEAEVLLTTEERQAAIAQAQGASCMRMIWTGTTFVTKPASMTGRAAKGCCPPPTAST